MAAWERIDDILTPEGIKRLEVGQVLMFDYEGSRNDLKIMRIKDGKVWAKHIVTYHPDEVESTAHNMLTQAEEATSVTPADVGKYLHDLGIDPDQPHTPTPPQEPLVGGEPEITDGLR